MEGILSHPCFRRYIGDMKMLSALRGTCKRLRDTIDGNWDAWVVALGSDWEEIRQIMTKVNRVNFPAWGQGLLAYFKMLYLEKKARFYQRYSLNNQNEWYHLRAMVESIRSTHELKNDDAIREQKRRRLSSSMEMLIEKSNLEEFEARLSEKTLLISQSTAKMYAVRSKMSQLKNRLFIRPTPIVLFDPAIQ